METNNKITCSLFIKAMDFFIIDLLYSTSDRISFREPGLFISPFPVSPGYKNKFSFLNIRLLASSFRANSFVILVRFPEYQKIINDQDLVIY